jgi:hypothetical protein
MNRRKVEADYSNPLRITLVFGQGSSGKTSFGIRYLINTIWSCAFIFDTRGQFASRLKKPHVGTAAQCDAALASGWVCFNPYVMFGADLDAAFNWFCDWAMRVSATGGGRKILLADDSWEFTSARTCSPEFARVVKLGRFWHLEFFGITHRPKEYHINVRSLVTEWVAFNVCESADIEDVSDYWPGVVKASALPKFEFLAFNRDSRSELRAKLPPP